jgi:hypothetical protein
MNSGKGKCMLIDTAISRDRNVTQQVAEKFLNKKDLTIEIQHMYNITTKVIPVIIGVTGTILQSFRKYLKTGKHEIKVLKETAILGTAHILQKVLM